MAASHPVDPDRPDYSHIRPLLLDMARARDTPQIAQLVLDRLVEVRNIAMVRLWLRGASDTCEVCRSQPTPEAVHLIGSAVDQVRMAEAAPAAPRAAASHLGPSDQTALLEQVELGPVYDFTSGVVPDEFSWVEPLGIGGLALQPLLNRDELLGAIEVFTWPRVAEEAPAWLRVIADHAAAAIANAQAYQEIDRLRRQLQSENEQLQGEIRNLQSFGEIVGRSAALQRILVQLEYVAPTGASVLITGESGTGKELVAREIHQRSNRSEQPMIRVNCAAIPSTLYESEFFGHVRGAFTGAVQNRMGRFEMADGGTIFLDEVGELPLDMQSKLLRVLQEGQYERVGESRTRGVDVRVVAATNRNLSAEVDAGRFRGDLFYRLNVFPIEVPPLRERMDDVLPLAEHLLTLAAAKLGRPRPPLGKAAAAQLLQYDWPGNVRELQNAVERALILARRGRLGFDLPMRKGRELQRPGEAPAAAPDGRAKMERVLRDDELRRLERDNLLHALEQARGKVSGPGGAADLLAIPPATLASRLRRLGLRDAVARARLSTEA
ncbi:MAG: sigma 54-interacting transcriptional regulator [Planctomycetota bacterium]